MVVSCLCRVRQRDFTHYVYLCVCLHVRDMYAAARALHSQGSGHFHALYACGSAGTFSLSRTTCMRQRGHFQSFTLKAARRHLGMSVCRRRRSAGLQRVSLLGLRSSLLEFALSRGSLSGGPCLRSCGPAVLRPCGCGLCCHAVSWFVLSCCQRCMRTTWHGSAPPVSRCHARGGAGAWWRWSLVALEPGGAGGLGALASSWRGGDDLARRGLGALWRCPCGPPCVAVLSAMPSGALGALKRGA